MLITQVIALSWAAAGAARIVITGRAEDLLAEVSEEIKRISPRTKVLPIRSEAASEDDTKSLWAEIKAKIGVIDVLIANAGVFSEKNDFIVTGKYSPTKWWYDFVSDKSTLGAPPYASCSL